MLTLIKVAWIPTIGNYKANAVGAAVKYSHKNEYHGWNVKTSALVSTTNIPGVEYSAFKNTQALLVKQDDFTSTVLGGMISASKGLSKGHVYGSVGLFQEFGAK